MDYPNIDDKPNSVIFNLEGIGKDFGSYYSEFEYPVLKRTFNELVREVFDVVCINANCNDNLSILTGEYFGNSGCVEEKISNELESNLIKELGLSLAENLKQLDLYAPDDTCYYEFVKAVSIDTILIKKVTPVEYFEKDIDF